MAMFKKSVSSLLLTLMALLIGLALNFLSADARLTPGLAFASRSLLRWGIVLVGVVVAWVVAGRAVRRVHRRHPLCCPRCGEEFFATFARATKCCNRCGWRIVAGGGD